MRILRGVLVAASLFVYSAQARSGDFVDLALVLAVDASSSVDYDEFNLQMTGLADAFRDEAVQSAIALAAPNGMAVTLVQWAGTGAQRQAFPWTILRGPGDAEDVAEAIDRTPRLIAGGGTAIADAIDFATELLRGNRIRATRRVIDVSGDGRGNMGPERALDAALGAIANRVTINGLAILNEDPALEQYYLTQVIGGANAFTMVADDYDDFAEAMRIKLIAEILGAPMF